MQLQNTFIHHVYFWLKNPESKQDYEALVAGLQKLSSVETIGHFHIGKAAGTSREVIDSSYSVSWLLLFKNKEDHDSYQADPVHLDFVNECSGLWRRVLVYDTADI